MTLTNGCLLGLFLLTFAPLASRAAPEAVDPNSLQVDRDIQSLKAEVLDIDQNALAIEEKFLYPNRSRLIVYVGVKPPGLLVDNVTVQIDSDPTRTKVCDVTEAYALQRKGLLRVVRQNIRNGAHRLRADITAHYADAAPETPPYKLHIEEAFEKTLDPSYLELSLYLKGLDNTPQLRLRDWRAAK